MSHPTRPLSHRSTLFKFPGVPPSPPETNSDVIGPSIISTTVSHPAKYELRPSEIEPSPSHSTFTPESAGARFRKTSSITYLTSGLNDSREREKAPQRSPKALIVIIPPTSLIQQHGQLGHTLASGPHHRLSNGLLMPLFPTMYGQLAAIAREFNFPSTAGLCLYLHYVDNGVKMTPRISDEIWPFVWAHVLEDSPAPKSPISGKIEFDLDMHQARWYASWLASSHRETTDHSLSVLPSVIPSVTHEPNDSNIKIQEEVREVLRSIVPTTRHVPRKLSLVDRYEMSSPHSGSRPVSRTTLSLPEHTHPSSSRILSPIFQDEEPKTAKQGLNDRINSWRSSAILKPTSLAITGETSLDPANNGTLSDTADEQLNHEDFAWSISSAGPDEYDPMSSVSWDRVPSVHIANRMEGSVCLTPSECTSFGPSDYTLSPPASSIYRLPSPDIGYRMLEDAPQTPSTATTWGAPDEYPPSPVFFSRPSSVDLGDRVVFSRSVTPTTATSWGPASWPSSPVYSEFISRSVHLDNRGDFSRPVTPSTATSWGPPLSWPPSPATPLYVTTPDAGHRGFEDTGCEQEQSFGSSTVGTDGSRSVARDAPWDHLWPYHSRTLAAEGHQRRSIPWAHIWPYHKSIHTRPLPQITVRVPSIYPHIVIYQPIYPHFDLYPRVTLAKSNSEGYPDFSLYPNTSPHITRHDLTVQRPISVKLTPCYPVFDLYPAIYPENLHQIYPSVAANDAGSVNSVSAYPFFLYPPFHSVPSQRPLVMQNPNIEKRRYLQRYPDFNLYPVVDEVAISSDLKGSGYPYFNLYPAVPSVSALRNNEVVKQISVQAKTSYPSLIIYPVVYPHFDIYPPLTLLTVTVAKPAECSVRLAIYPVFNIYPVVYPAFDIYPRIERSNSLVHKQVGSRVLDYPRIQISAANPPKSQSVRVPPSYPSFNLYPSIYPFFELYPVLVRDVSRAPKLTVDPAFDLYSGHQGSPKVFPNITDHTRYAYPIFNLPVYPHFDLYPVIAGMVESEKAVQSTTGTITVKVQSHYPAFSLYPAVYPHFDLWPSIDLPQIEPVPRCRAKSLHGLTHKDLHATVMVERARSTFIKSNRLNTQTNSHAELHYAVFPDGIVTTPSGTWVTDGPIDIILNSAGSPEALRRRVSTLRPNNVKLPLPASPRPLRRLPPSLSESHHVHWSVIGSESAQDKISKDEISSLQTSRDDSTHFDQDVGLHPLPLNRSRSLMNDPNLMAMMSEKTSRPKSLVASPPRRRDSLVSHRARVYTNGSQDGIKLPMETLSKVPVLPVPPVPRVPPKS